MGLDMYLYEKQVHEVAYCGNFVIECTCNSEPDRMYGDED